MFNVLIAEDDNNIRKLMEIKLKASGFNVISAKDGEIALQKYYENHIDIMVIDIMMPIMDGYELLSELRNSGETTPAILCTARGGIDDKAQGFALGVDDYMVKPVDFDELVMRIKAVMKRAKIVIDRKICLGDTFLDYDSLSVYNDNLKIQLTKTEFNILFKLMSYPEKTFSKSQLFEEFWDFDSDTEEDVVKVYVNKIRNKIQPFNNIDIETIRGVGYRGIKIEK